MDWAKTTARRDDKQLSFGIWCALYQRFAGNNVEELPVHPMNYVAGFCSSLVCCILFCHGHSFSPCGFMLHVYQKFSGLSFKSLVMESCGCSFKGIIFKYILMVSILTILSNGPSMLNFVSNWERKQHFDQYSFNTINTYEFNPDSRTVYVLPAISKCLSNLVSCDWPYFQKLWNDQ